jgi:hypothetical protein
MIQQTNSTILTYQVAKTSTSICPMCGEQHEGISNPYLAPQLVKPPTQIIAELRHEIQSSQESIEGIKFIDTPFPLETEWLQNFTHDYAIEINLPFISSVFPTTDRIEAFQLLQNTNASAIILHLASKKIDTDKLTISYENLNATIAAIQQCGIHVLIEIPPYLDILSEEDCRKLFDTLISIPGPFGIIPYQPETIPSTCLYNKILNTQAQKKAPHSKEAIFWNAVYQLIQFDSFDLPKLEAVMNDEFIKQNPSILEEMVNNLVDSIYLNGNPLRTKDEQVTHLRNRILQKDRLSNSRLFRFCFGLFR